MAMVGNENDSLLRNSANQLWFVSGYDDASVKLTEKLAGGVCVTPPLRTFVPAGQIAFAFRNLPPPTPPVVVADVI